MTEPIEIRILAAESGLCSEKCECFDIANRCCVLHLDSGMETPGPRCPGEGVFVLLEKGRYEALRDTLAAAGEHYYGIGHESIPEECERAIAERERVKP